MQMTTSFHGVQPGRALQWLLDNMPGRDARTVLVAPDGAWAVFPDSAIGDLIRALLRADADRPHSRWSVCVTGPDALPAALRGLGLLADPSGEARP